MAKTDIEKMIEEETKNRLSIMERPDYIFPPKIGRGDWIAMALAIGASAVLIVLCMMGVIE